MSSLKGREGGKKRGGKKGGRRKKKKKGRVCGKGDREGGRKKQEKRGKKRRNWKQMVHEVNHDAELSMPQMVYSSG